MKNLLKTLSFFIAIAPLGLIQAYGGLPEVNINLSTTFIEKGKSFEINASDSRSSNGEKGGLLYRFKTSRNQDWSAWGYWNKINHTPTKTGTYYIKVEVKEIETGATARAYRTYKVKDLQYGREAKIEILTQQIMTNDIYK